MQVTKKLALAAFASVAFVSASAARVDPDRALPPPSALQLVVMEAPGCIYCAIFRRDVLPAYQASERGRELPVRFVDLNDEAANSLALNTPVEIVPTFIVMAGNREIGRIAGYLGPENFYHSINYLMSSAP